MHTQTTTRHEQEWSVGESPTNPGPRAGMSRGRRLRRHRGSAIVEFALVVPALLTMLLGIMECGVLVRNNLLVANAAREGVRAAALGKSTDQVNTRVRNAMVPTYSTSDATVTVAQEVSTDNGATYTTMSNDAIDSTKNGASTGSLVRVTITAPHRTLTGFFPFLRNRQVRCAVAMRREAT